MAKIDAKKKYQSLKSESIYDEEKHCQLIIEVMGNPKQATHSAFCVKAGISGKTFYKWLDKYPIFDECYQYGKMLARFNWEQEAEDLDRLDSKDVGCRYEIWRLRGWSQFGIGKNSRIRVSLKKSGTPAEHYHDILRQAGNGDFTAGEIKQLMEAVNVGLNAHQAFELQKQIDELKETLELVEARSNE